MALLTAMPSSAESLSELVRCGMIPLEMRLTPRAS
jgi:hypothetical protein